MSTQWVRREPPRFRRLAVARVEQRTPHLARVTLTGPELEGFSSGLPAASVRLLVPSGGSSELVMPTWDGNEFLLPDGTRPTIRTFTPLRHDATARELDLEIVLHPDGAIAGWAGRAQAGDEAAISGPGRGYVVDETASAFLLAGDESALPAITQLLPLVPRTATAEVIVELGHPDARLELPDHPGLSVTWRDRRAGGRSGDALVEAVRAASIPEDANVWVAGEAAAVQAIRKHLFDQRGMTRAQATVRGYWKHGRAGDQGDS